MGLRAFPPVDEADETGLLAIGGDLEVATLLLAYRSGIFPWPFDDRFIAWFAPPERAVLFLDQVKYPRSLEKTVRSGRFLSEINRATAAVIEECAKPINRPGQSGSWITGEIRAAYVRLAKAGSCHSFESYRDGLLVGGLYGVSIGGMFAGESMFYRSRDASKVALFHLCEHLKQQGVPWIDCQVLSPLLASFGAVEIARREFMELLHEQIHRPAITFPRDSVP